MPAGDVRALGVDGKRGLGFEHVLPGRTLGAWVSGGRPMILFY
jgi:hypothetical protein